MQRPITTDQVETSPPSAVVFDRSPALSWLTVERAAYLGLALLALVLRLANLGVVPLSDAEAAQALVAWNIYQDQPLDQVGYSPLVVTLDLVGFALLGDSEFAARLGPALLGVALVLLPYGLRRYLGRAGALAASALFAISPTAVFLSRSVNGDIGAAVGGLTLTVGLFGWLDWEPNWRSSRLSWLIVAAVGLVLLLTTSPSAYSTLALLLGFVVLAEPLSRRVFSGRSERLCGADACRNREGGSCRPTRATGQLGKLRVGVGHRSVGSRYRPAL